MPEGVSFVARTVRKKLRNSSLGSLTGCSASSGEKQIFPICMSLDRLADGRLQLAVQVSSMAQEDGYAVFTAAGDSFEEALEILASVIRELFARESVIVTKRGKNGPVEQDIIPMLSRMEVSEVSDRELELTARVCAQNPSLNPQQMVTAIEANLPGHKPNFTRIFRREVLDSQGNIFR